MNLEQRLAEELAVSLGVRPNAILQWRKRRTVPHRWRLPILHAASARGTPLGEEVFERFGPVAEIAPDGRTKGGPMVSASR